MCTDNTFTSFFMTALKRSPACWVERDSALILDHLGKPSLKCNFSSSALGCVFFWMRAHGVLCSGMWVKWDGTGLRWPHSERKRDIWMFGVTSCTVLRLFRASTWHIQLKARVGKQGPCSLLSEVLLPGLATPSPGMEVNCRAMVSESFHFISCGQALPRF